MKQVLTRTLKTALLSLALCSPMNANELPLLGDSTSGIISLDEEYKLGNAWVRVLRAQAPMLNDPLTYHYVSQLLQRLATYSPLQDRRLTLVVINNSSLNAFAVPGGIIGVNSGLFLYSTSEGEFASVLAHELSHLSQRHYAQRLNEEQKSLPLQLATTLAGILLMATTDGQAGTAAIIGGQAAAAQRQLAFSRSNEQEADRIGMQVLAEAGYNPKVMPQMFTQMQRSISNLGRKPPEFLLTHPVTESRVADAMNRAAQLPQDGRVDSLDYQLIRTRVKILSQRDINNAYQLYRGALANQPSDINRYGLALSAIHSNRYPQAQDQLDKLLAKTPNSLVFKLLQCELWLAQGQPEPVIKELKQLLAIYPDNHPLTMQLAKAYHHQGEHEQLVELLQQHSKVAPNDTQLWYQLAEAYGLIQDIKGVHLARAEYFLLKGAVPRAQEHLQLALKQESTSELERAEIQQRMKEADQIQASLKF